ncbi:MAG: GAF domain-containing protein, partial [bacterium]
MSHEPTSGGPAPGHEPTLPRVSIQSLIGPDGIAGPERFNDLLLAATRQCRRLVDCERVRVWIVRSNGRRLVARDFPDAGAPTEVRLRREMGLAGWVQSRGEPLRLAPGDPAPPGLRGVRELPATAIVLPLYRRGEVFGVLECVGKRDGAFSDADFDRLEVAAEGVAFSLDYALLSQEIERRALEKEVLLDVTRLLAAPFDLEEVVESIITGLRQVVDFDAAAVYLVARDTASLEMVSEFGYPEGSEVAFELQMGEGIVGWVAKSGEPVIVPDVHRDGRYVAARSSTRSEIAAPLLSEGRVIGVFNLESDHLDLYHEGH